MLGIGITLIKAAYREHIMTIEAQRNLEAEISELLAETKDAKVIPSVSTFPNTVNRFIDNIDRNFLRTMDELVNRAVELEHAAKELRERAERLSTAKPFLAKEIRDWVSYERECAARQQALALVKPSEGG